MTDVHFRNADGINSDAVSLAKPLPVALSAQSAATTDGSGTIAAGGTAQNLFGGATPPNGFAVYNDDAANDLWISDTGTALANAAGSIRVAANGGGYESPAGRKPKGAVSIVGALTGQKFTASAW
jgi:hypothetical protein